MGCLFCLLGANQWIKSLRFTRPVPSTVDLDAILVDKMAMLLCSVPPPRKANRAEGLTSSNH